MERNDYLREKLSRLLEEKAYSYGALPQREKPKYGLAIPKKAYLIKAILIPAGGVLGCAVGLTIYQEPGLLRAVAVAFVACLFGGVGLLVGKLADNKRASDQAAIRAEYEYQVAMAQYEKQIAADKEQAKREAPMRYYLLAQKAYLDPYRTGEAPEQSVPAWDDEARELLKAVEESPDDPDRIAPALQFLIPDRQ